MSAQFIVLYRMTLATIIMYRSLKDASDVQRNQ